MSSDMEPTFVELNDLASSTCGTAILFSTDDFFAVAENLLQPHEPIWKEGVFTKFGKWMDGWESRRRRSAGHDWCIIQLGIPGVIHGVDLDTCFFTGNNAPRASIQAACLNQGYPAREGKMGAAASKQQWKQVAKLGSEAWEEILSRKDLGPGFPKSRHNYFTISSRKRWTHIRLNIFPDGGVARLRLYGLAKPDWSKVPLGKEIDLVAMKNGGVCTGFSDAHYGHARNVISPGRSQQMDQGWETARKPDRPHILNTNEHGVLLVPGFEWASFKFGHVGIVSRVEISTHHFKGNFADSCSIEGCLVNDDSTFDAETAPWKLILPAQKLKAHSYFRFAKPTLNDVGAVNHVRLVTRPDGGIARLRIFGFRVSLAKL